ncbi:tagatose-bisphosphate aldolase [Palleronia sediminis]|uniref:Tagatose-bisphosphate aldolase n=1 Tax=Palleronia sediminis TaxID=2547833 RepID=A0A4R6A9Q2_9RHOB|nr:class II D-tagatose-bisphosphate aldolase, non-catalytic subunit [Palleronia sediminis]TDL79424.1 tagatose-bisphosphate aldolase [Palleronia sediminis]
MTHPLQSIPEAFHAGRPAGITSVCSAHPIVIEAALSLGRETGKTVLIEATCNQVNQDGGYTGMTPAGFRDFVEGIAARVGFDTGRLVLGGDHLGPNPWKHLPADAAMAKAEAMIAAFAQAGFTKLHLDTSMGCRAEAPALDDAQTAERAARLARVAEDNRGAVAPVYIIGTEVPVPGGAIHALQDGVVPTAPEAVRRTYDVHERAFAALGLDDAWSRVIGLVVQPGVEFGDTEVVHFDPAGAAGLTETLADRPGLVFEAHSTDYQTAESLRTLVLAGFPILKVGPWLTFALREALYGLDAAVDILDGHTPRGRLMTAMEDAMIAAPENWSGYYAGDADALWIKRHFSLSDRIRYYWPDPRARAAVEELFDRLAGRTVPATVAAQFIPGHDVRRGDTTGHALLVGAVQDVLRIYDRATDPA